MLLVHLATIYLSFDQLQISSSLTYILINAEVFNVIFYCHFMGDIFCIIMQFDFLWSLLNIVYPSLY